MARYFIYQLQIKDDFKPKLALDKKYSCRYWKPSLLKIIPAGVPLLPFIIWWIFHYLKIFTNKDYEITLIYANKKLIHFSAAVPAFFRFPFMSKQDIQVTNIWTHPDYRRKGIATFACEQIILLKKRPGRIFWYVFAENNLPSMKVAEKCGFFKIAEGVWSRLLGIQLCITRTFAL